MRLEGGPEIEATEEGRDGNSCDTRSELDVFCLMGGRRWSRAGDPTRKAVGTFSTEGFLLAVGEPAWRGEGNPSMAALYACSLLQACAMRAKMGRQSLGVEAVRGASVSSKEAGDRATLQGFLLVAAEQMV